MRAAAYLVWLAGTVVLLAVAALALTITTDPYRTFGVPGVLGWTELKPRAYERIGIAKTNQLERIIPKTLVLGNSRTEIGLDPASPGWHTAGRPVFNAAVAGGDVFRSLAMLREDLALLPPDLIVLGLDFLDILTELRDPPGASNDERRLLVDRNGRPNLERSYQIWKDRLASTLTIDAIADSARTLFDQNPETSATMTPLGFNPLHEYRIFVARSGYQGLFAQKNAIYRKQYATYPKPDLAHPSRIAAYRHLTAILQLATEHGIPLILYIHPYHADYLEMLHDLGLWRSFEAWKRVVVAAVEQTAREKPADIRIFDFSGYNELTTEQIPAPGDRRSEMRWYWEPGHYKSALGEQILATIFHADPHFGRLLTPASIEAVLSDIQEQRTWFVGQHTTGDKGPQTLLKHK